MATDKTGRRVLSEAAREPRPKPALGPPHDTYATVGLSLAFAAALSFAGRASVEADAVGWTGMLTSLAMTIALIFYFQRAYGFSSRGWGNTPKSAVMAAVFGFIFMLQFVPAALYQQYFQESLLGYSMSCLALAILSAGILRAALGKASTQTRADETVPLGGTSDTEIPRAAEERE